MSALTYSVPVPTTGDGPAVDVSLLTGTKTIQLAGNFIGSYDLLGSQDGSTFVPVAQFDAGRPSEIETAVDGALKSVKLRSRTSSSSGVSCWIAGLSGTCGFATLASYAAGGSGTSLPVDLQSVLAPTGPTADLSFTCSGTLEGSLVVEGSSDGSEYNPIGSFRASGTRDQLAFSPLLSPAQVRYVRTRLAGATPDGLVVTVGGSTGPSNSGGPSVLPTTIVDVANYQVSPLDVILQVTRTASGACQIQLPAVAAGRLLITNDSGYNTSVNNITLVPSGSDKVNDVAGPFAIGISGTSISLVGNATTHNWEIT